MALLSKEMQIEASENTQSTTDMLKLLWNLAPHVEALPEMFINVADRHYLESPELEFMFTQVKDTKKCQEFLNAVMLTMSLDKRSGYIAILDLMLESNFEIEVTNKLVMSTFNAHIDQSCRPSSSKQWRSNCHRRWRIRHSSCKTTML